MLWLSKHAVGSLLLTAPKVVTGAYRGSVKISCQYNFVFRENTKYWCKGRVYDLCSIVVKTHGNQSSDRSFIKDDKEAGVFTVTMTTLNDYDEDKYWCVIATPGRNVHTGVRLHISHTGITQLDCIKSKLSDIHAVKTLIYY